jgi:colicin import membrane protein
MIRGRENPLALKAGILSMLVHGLLLALLVVSFSWRNVVQPPQITQVELWDRLPTLVEPQPEPPKPLPKVEPPPAPEPKPEPPAPRAEIQVKAKPPAEIKPKPEKKPVEPPKPDPRLKAMEEEQKRKDALRKLQQDLLKDEHPVDRDADKVAAEARAAAEAKRATEALEASTDLVNEYKGKIQAKIKRYVNKQLCGTGKPILVFTIALLPTGEVAGSPRLVKGSGIAACDQAVERAIMQAQPLPLPPQAELFAQFRDLNLQFRPNEE